MGVCAVGVLERHQPLWRGDGQVGLHGTNDQAGIGRAVSHGCIRVRNTVIERLAALLPLGTPVRIMGGARQFTGL
jgi:lipoprotein-anchoring transpeptidase ErfK/SrfK